MTMTFGANWKANPVGDRSATSLEKAIQLLDSYAKEGLATLTDREVLIYVPSILISKLSSYIEEVGYGFKLGAQNVSSYPKGAHTGQTPAEMFMDYGVKEFLIGHSERRDGYERVATEVYNLIVQHLKDKGFTFTKPLKKELSAKVLSPTNTLYNSKIQSVLEKEGTQITYCIGETLDERTDGRTFDVLEVQLSTGLKNVSKEDYGRIRIAYEPRWAIGGDTTPPTEEEIYAAHNKIREVVGKGVPILHGGGVNPENIAEIMGIGNVDGVLVGGASLDPKKFASIVLFDRK